MPRSFRAATRSPVGVVPSDSLARMASQAWAMTEHTLAVEIEPPATGAGGRSVSPSSTVTRPTGRPSRSAATCAATV